MAPNKRISVRRISIENGVHIFQVITRQYCEAAQFVPIVCEYQCVACLYRPCYLISKELIAGTGMEIHITVSVGFVHLIIIVMRYTNNGEKKNIDEKECLSLYVS